MILRIVIAVFVFALLGSTGCMRNRTETLETGIQGQGIRISGVISGCSNQEIILEEMGAREFIPIDTVTCDESGRFEMSITSEAAAFYVLRIGPATKATLLIEPGESIEFSGTLNQLDSYQVKGSPGSELLQALAREHKQTLQALGGITRKNMEHVSSPEYSSMKMTFDRQFDSITSQFKTYSQDFIEKNASSLAILVALYNMYGQGLPVFDPGEDFQTYKFVDSALMASHSEFEAVRLLHAQLLESEQLLKENQTSLTLQKGQIAPDFVSSRPDGSQMALAELKGNYVLLSFWAGWSKLSREENSTLRKVDERFRDQNFQILQVSLDDQRESWTAALREDKLNWNQVSDLKRWESLVVDLYHVDKIPFNVLIDPTGQVIETNLFGEDLINKLENIFTQ